MAEALGLSRCLQLWLQWDGAGLVGMVVVMSLPPLPSNYFWVLIS